MHSTHVLQLRMRLSASTRRFAHCKHCKQQRFAASLRANQTTCARASRPAHEARGSIPSLRNNCRALLFRLQTDANQSSSAGILQFPLNRRESRTALCAARAAKNCVLLLRRLFRAAARATIANCAIKQTKRRLRRNETSANLCSRPVANWPSVA